jgi:hypothetical protein
MNLYEYVRSNPHLLTDSTGMQSAKSNNLQPREINPHLTPESTKEHPVLTEMVVSAKVPYETEVSDPEVYDWVKNRQGRVGIDDAIGAAKGVYEGVRELSDPFGFGVLPEAKANAKQAAGALIGKEITENLGLEGLAALAPIAKGAKPIVKSGIEEIKTGLSLIGGSGKAKIGAAAAKAIGSGRAYSVALEVELKSKWGKGIPKELRRRLHQVEARELIAEEVQALLKSGNPADRKAGEKLAKLLANPSEWHIHHDAFRKGAMQLVPKAQHQARELQDLLHPFIEKYMKRVGGFKLWGRNF